MSLYNYAHDDQSILFGAYPDSSNVIKSSAFSYSYRIKKSAGNFEIERGSVTMAGNTVSWNPALKIYAAGQMDITSLYTTIAGGNVNITNGNLVVAAGTITTNTGIKLPNAYGAGTILSFHEHYSTTVSTSKYLGAGTVSAVSVYVTAERTGRTVTVTVSPSAFSTGITIGTGGASVFFTRLPVQFKPRNEVSQVVVINENGVYSTGQLIVNSLGDVALLGGLSPSGSFSVGINRGTPRAASVSYETL